MRRMSEVGRWLAVACLIAACENPGEPEREAATRIPGVISNVTPEGCEIKPELCPSRYPPGDPVPDFAGSLHNYNVLTGLNEPTSPADPSPGKEGIWLNLLPSDCWEPYYKSGSAHTDRDADGFDDNCELRLAQAFAPMIRFGAPGIEDCPGGEAYWAAKYFDNVEPFHTGDFVRIAYLMSYYKDCGKMGHQGDSEFIQLTVTFVNATKHWKLINSWISAHAVIGKPFGNSILGPVGSNSSTWGSNFEWPSGRKFSYPRIWVSTNKHANYRSESACDNGGVFFGIAESCTSVQDNGRFRVWTNNNIGSAHKHMKNCVPSMKNSGSPVECFWGNTDFGGWQPSGSAASPFLPILNSIVYGCYMLTAGLCWASSWGM